MEDTFEPLIIALCCNWCSYAGADLAGVSRSQYPPSIRIVRVMCSGMVHPNLVIDALTKGADGVLMCGCHPGDCHYQEGNLKAEKRAEAIKLMLPDFGIEEERFAEPARDCRLRMDRLACQDFEHLGAHVPQPSTVFLALAAYGQSRRRGEPWQRHL